MARPRRASPPVEFSNLNKVFFPATGFTKGDLIKYYIDIAPVMLPHFRSRPVTRIRMPDGVNGEKFYEKNAPGHAPDWIRIAPVPRTEGGVINYIVVDDVETLAWCANNAAIELHPFLHRAEAIDVPTHVAFDLDPGEGADMLTCIEVAFLLRDVFQRLKLKAFPKVTGSKGLQLYIPLNRGLTYDVVTPFAKSIAELMHREHPDLVVSEMPKFLRVQKVFIDWSQNHMAKTTVGAYSVRGKRDEPFVSTPVKWEELRRAQKAGKIEPLFFSPAETLKRVARFGDLFAPVLKLKQRLPDEIKAALPRRRRAAQPPRPPRALAAYAAKRDFNQTAEPGPELPTRSAQGSRRRFVIQKHAASHLHYDFRLELHDVLKSWAIPKGVPTEMGVKRSAFQVEDHPLDYFSFEGVIPAGQYGGGTVMVWDIGTYDIIDGNYWNGDLKLWLDGKKLKGEWHIFRIKSKDERPERAVWLMQKAKEPAKPLTPKQENTSAVSGRTMEEIAAAADAVWQSNRDEDGAKPSRGLESHAKEKRKVKPAKLAPAPEFVEPMKAREVAELKPEEGWIYEIKWDGYRVLGLKHGDTVRLLSRNAKSLTKDFPTVAEAVQRISAKVALLDGEVVALDEQGRPSFQMLQHRASGEGRIAYYAYDLLSLEGEDWRKRPLHERKAKLAEIIAGSGINFSASLEGALEDIIAGVKQLGLEGIVAKRDDSPYKSGDRSGAWLKLKFSPAQEFVIGGFKRGSPLESLVVGYHAGGELLCAGKVRQGLNPRNRRELYERLKPLFADVCPFANLPNSKKSHWGEGITAEQMKEIQWVMPKVVAQVRFVEWTRGGALRHGTFEGLRTDKAPKEVVRELK